MDKEYRKIYDMIGEDVILDGKEAKIISLYSDVAIYKTPGRKVIVKYYGSGRYVMYMFSEFSELIGRSDSKNICIEHKKTLDRNLKRPDYCKAKDNCFNCAQRLRLEK